MFPSIIFLGAASASREFFWYFHETYPEAPIAFADDYTSKSENIIGGVSYPIVKDWDFSGLRKRYPHIRGAFTEFLIGVADPPIKKVLVEKALAHGLRPAPSFITTCSKVRPDCTLGRGGIIVDTLYSSGAVLGDYLLSMFCTYGSDVRVRDYVTTYTGCHVASDVLLEEGVCLGASTTVKERVRIAPWCVTGQSASVVKSVTEKGITLVGVPARKLERSASSLT